MERAAGRWMLLGAGLLLALAIWLPRGLALDRFVTADEHAWLARSGNFYRALTHGDLAGTFQRHHPGVTVTWIGTAGFLTSYPGYAQDAPGYFGWLTEEIEPFLRSQGHDPVEVLAAGRAWMVVAITLVLLGSFAYGVRLLGLWPSVAGFALIALDPFHIAHARLLHIDGLVSSLMLLAVLAFLGYLAERRGSSLVVSAVAAGLAALTRSPALFLGPLAVLLAGLDWVWIKRSRASAEKPASSLVPVIRDLAIWGLIAAAVFTILWPSMWVDPIGSMQQVLSAAEEYAEEGHLKPIFFDGALYAGDPGLSFYPLTFLWRTTPVTLIGLGLAVALWFTRRAPLENAKARFAVAGLALYAVAFMLFMDLGAKKFDRYLLPSYLPLDIIAGVGWVGACVWLGRALGGKRAAVVAATLASAVVALQAVTALPSFPYYLDYYNPLLGGAGRAPQVMMIGWGEGADEAARWLDTQPNAAELTAASGYTNGPFSYFFAGKTLPITFWQDADYAVVYAQDWQRQLPARRMIDYWATLTPSQVVTLGGIDYAHIYDLRDAPLPDFVTDWGNAIRLVSYQLPAAPISAGETFRAIFNLANLAPLDRNLNVLVRVVGPDGNEVARSEGWPWGAPTRDWPQGEVRPDGHDLTIPTETPPGYYRVELGFYDPATQELLPATQAVTGEPQGDLVPLEFVQVGQPPTRPDQPLTPPAQLGDTGAGGPLSLLGATWRDGAGAVVRPDRLVLQAGDPFGVELFWRGDARMDRDYTAFVHVVGPDGSLATQADQPPLQGFLPTSAWFPGQVVADTYPLTLPADAPPGEYRVVAGMYDPATVTRLPVQGGEDTVTLGTVTVE